jgi:phosphoglycerate dehydrogenase-like enzyme
MSTRNRRIPLGILAADDQFRAPKILAQLTAHFEVHDFADWRSYDPRTLVEKCRSVEIVLTGRSSPPLPRSLAKDFGRLRWLCHWHGTIRHLCDKKLVEAGLLVTNWGDAVDGIAEGAMALLLCQLKQLPALDALTKRQATDERIYQMFPCTLKGRDVGLYGFGPIGQHMARMLMPFGARVAIHDPYAKNVPRQIRRCETLRELFATCQIISIHCGLNKQTQDSVGRELLDLLPQGGIVINTARGGIVDEAALAEFVKQGRLLAGVDVIRDEGKWAQSPLAPFRGAVLTHHQIGSGKGYPPGQAPNPELPDYIVHNLRAYRLGKPLVNVITPAIYDLKT